jgi:hypothetical protein
MFQKSSIMFQTGGPPEFFPREEIIYLAPSLHHAMGNFENRLINDKI